MNDLWPYLLHFNDLTQDYYGLVNLLCLFLNVQSFCLKSRFILLQKNMEVFLLLHMAYSSSKRWISNRISIFVSK